jgi:hypothetical protein
MGAHPQPARAHAAKKPRDRRATPLGKGQAEGPGLPPREAPFMAAAHVSLLGDSPERTFHSVPEVPRAKLGPGV